MPCATTPAPTDDGRAKPRSTRGRTPRDADARWLEGGRQFAPWHYTVEAMLQDAKGVLHNPPPEVKELGNGWHWGGFSAPGPSRHGHLGQAGGFWYIARTASAPGHHPVAVPILGPSTVGPRAPAATRATGHGRRLGRGEPLGGRSPDAAYAGRLADPGTGRGGYSGVEDASMTLPPGWTPCPTTCGPLTSPRTGPAPFRARCSTACSEAWATPRPTTSARTWTRALTCWGRFARRLGGGVAPTSPRGSTDFGGKTRPMWRGKPPRPGIRSTPGRFSTSWWPRLAWAGSRALARPPTIGRCQPSPSRPWQTWSFANRRRAIASRPSPSPSARSTRTASWRRSGHNATLQRPTSPPTTSWGISLTSSFAPGLRGGTRWFSAMTSSAAGVTLWFHFAMCFGAAASVWNFNRAADAVQMLLLLVLLGHFVDDFNGVDSADLADSAHHAVADFFALLGLQTKPSKAQAPAKRHVGVELSVRPEGVELSPTALRTKKILGQIDGALARDSLSPDEASRLAGRLTFLSQSTFGSTGRAAIKPVLQGG